MALSYLTDEEAATVSGLHPEWKPDTVIRPGRGCIPGDAVPCKTGPYFGRTVSTGDRTGFVGYDPTGRVKEINMEIRAGP